MLSTKVRAVCLPTLRSPCGAWNPSCWTAKRHRIDELGDKTTSSYGEGDPRSRAKSVKSGDMCMFVIVKNLLVKESQ